MLKTMSYALNIPGKPTYADIQALPPHVVGEILDGELVVRPRPALSHSVAASRLGALLGPPFDLGLGGPGGWWIVDEPELSLPDAPADSRLSRGLPARSRAGAPCWGRISGRRSGSRGCRVRGPRAPGRSGPP
jgi:hypothetical protein